MPMNNNQKVQSAAARLAHLPVVRSACAKLSVLYTDTKCCHPNLKSVCDVLESSVTALGTAACDRVSPVIVKLEPQISIANEVACKSLDWLETSFPVLLSPTEEIVAIAKNKLHQVQDVVSITASGTMECVQHTVTRVMSRMQQVNDGVNQSLVDRAISVASEGLDSAVSFSEALLDQVLPPTQDDEEETAALHLLQGFEAATVRGRYPARLVSLTVKLCKRTSRLVGSKMQSVQVMESLSRSSALVQGLQTSCLTLIWSLQWMPQYLQHQALSVLFFIFQTYHLSHQPAEQEQAKQVRSDLCAAEPSLPQRDVVQVHLQAAPLCRMRPFKTSAFENGCNVKGFVNC